MKPQRIQLSRRKGFKLPPNTVVVLDARGESETGILKVRIVDDKTADELARREGGRAQDS